MNLSFFIQIENSRISFSPCFLLQTFIFQLQLLPNWKTLFFVAFRSIRKKNHQLGHAHTIKKNQDFESWTLNFFHPSDTCFFLFREVNQIFFMIGWQVTYKPKFAIILQYWRNGGKGGNFKKWGMDPHEIIKETPIPSLV